MRSFLSLLLIALVFLSASSAVADGMPEGDRIYLKPGSLSGGDSRRLPPRSTYEQPRDYPANGSRYDERSYPRSGQEFNQVQQPLYRPEGRIGDLDDVNRRTAGTMITGAEHDVLHKILFYIPNRVIDLWDIFRGDVGVGSSGGAVIRATRYGQFGYRYVEPLAFRLGPQGRRFPFFIERDTEGGAGAGFTQSTSRHVTPYEVGLGLDLLIVGAYAGLSFDEAWDFITGWFLFDTKGDDF